MDGIILIGWFTASKNGSDIPMWRERIATCGVDVSDEHSPVYFDRTPRKPRGEAVSFDMLPELGAAIRALRVARGLGLDRGIVVPNFGHFADEAVWKTAWPKIEELGGFVICAETRQEVRSLDDGLHLMRQKRGRTTADRKRKARLAVGRPTKKMAPNKRADAIRFFGDRDWTIPAICAHCDIKPLTLRRRMLEWTGTDSKIEAVMLADEGRWPPKRKMK